MITISFKTQGTNCLYKFFIKFQSNQNENLWVNKSYISVADTISSVIQKYGVAFWFEICMSTYSEGEESLIQI